MGLDNPLHIAFLLIILLLVFGAKRLPEMGRSLGEGLRGFKDTISGETHTHHAVATEHTDATRPAAHVVQTPPQAIVAAPDLAVVTPVVHAPATEDPQVIAAARTLGAHRDAVEERSIERESELLRS